jgi:hypothetical protein
VRVSLVKGRAWSLGSGFPVRMSLEGEPGHWGDPSEGEPSKRESLVTGEIPVRVSLVKGRAWSLGSGFPVRVSLVKGRAWSLG